MNKELEEWEDACQMLAIAFIEKYYPDYINDWDWVGGERGHVVMVSDVFLDCEQMANAFRYEATPEQWNEWYWSYDENSEEMHRPMNLKNFVKYNESKPK